MARPVPFSLLLFASIFLASCAKEEPAAPTSPIPGGVPCDELILPGEVHFKHMWKLTSGGENAEGYFSYAGDRMVYQRTEPEPEGACDRIWVTAKDGGAPQQVSNGKGVTTCAYFLPDDGSVLYASTHAGHDTCPPRPDRSKGYVWAIYPEYDIYVQDLATGKERTLVSGEGYDAEATVSPTGDKVVFTSVRSGDIELWTCDLEGQNLFQVTDKLGYDGGAFFSPDGEWLVFRSTEFKTEDTEADQQKYRELLAENLVKPGAMEIYVVRTDGTQRKQVTHLGEANWAPYFFPDGKRIIFSSNHDWNRQGPPNFDLWAIDVDGTNLERITTYDEGDMQRNFDAFPMFSPDGRYLIFGSNRGGAEAGETNLFVVEWQ